jgi:hypothetical protein
MATIDPGDPIEAGDLVALTFSDGRIALLTHWLGSTGRGASGRFIKPGSSDEMFQFDMGLCYRRDNVNSGLLRILGKVGLCTVLGGQPPRAPRAA